MTTDTRESLATEFAAAFTSSTRENGAPFSHLRNNAPEWMRDAVHDAHGDMLPDDWRYRMIKSVADSLAETDPDEWQDVATEIADACVDVYTSNLTDWLASSIARTGYCDDAAEEYGTDDTQGIVRRIMLGQFAEYLEIANSLIASIEAQAETLTA